MNEEYVIKEGTREYKIPKIPNTQDYYDLNETEEERTERIYLYDEVK